VAETAGPRWADGGGGAGRGSSSAGIEGRLRAEEHRWALGKLPEGSVQAVVAWVWRPTVTRCSPEEWVGRQRWEELGTSWAGKFSGQMEQGESTDATEPKRGGNKAGLRRNCDGGGRSSGVQSWQPGEDVALRWGASGRA
jgi:hypothetical protein